MIEPKITMTSCKDGRFGGVKVGDVLPTKRGGDVTVLSIDGYKKVLVRFNDSMAYEATTTIQSLMDGNIKNPYGITSFGVGYFGLGEFSSKDHPLAYEVWRGMLRRCYDEKLQEKIPTYIGCTVADEWHDFQNFAKWYTSHDYYGLDYHLDKDLMFRGNKIYSKETCSLVPAKINTILTNLSASNSKSLTGVTYKEKKGLFQARIKSSGIVRNLGFFETEIEAHNAYIRNKEKIVKMAAIEHRYEMEEVIFKALMNWSFYE